MKFFLYLLSAYVIGGCVHTASLAPTSTEQTSPTIADRLFLACNTFRKFGLKNPRQLTENLNGTLVSDGEIRGSGFKLASLWKGQDYEELVVYFSVDQDSPLTLGDLESRFRTPETISESKTSSVRFNQASPPCGELYISASLFSPRVNDGSPILSLKMRRSTSTGK